MQNAKITTQRARRIRDAIMAGRFEKRRDALLDRWARIACDAYDLKYTKKTREQMYALPSGWLFERTDIQVAFGEASDDYLCLEFSGRCYCSGLLRLVGTAPAEREEIFKRFLNESRTNPIKPDADAPIVKRFRELRAATAALQAENETLANEIEQAIYGSGSTLKAVIARWPEIEPIVTPLFSMVPSTPLPAPILTDLNKKLGFKKAA